MRRALDFIESNPGRYIEMSPTRLVKTHGYETINVGGNSEGITQRFGEYLLMPLKLLSTVYWCAVLFAALAGLGLLLWRIGILSGFLHPTVMLWAYFTAIQAVVLSMDRYHFVSIPMIAALAAYATSLLVEHRQRTPRRSLAAATR